MCRSTISSKQGQDSLSKRPIQGPLKSLFETSGMQGASESNMAASSSARPQIQPVHGKLIAKTTKIRKGNHEKNAFKHGVGSCGPVCMGTGRGDHHNDDHD